MSADRIAPVTIRRAPTAGVPTRREVLAVLPFLGALAALRAGEAQPSSGPFRIGFLPLGSSTSAYDRSLVDAFRQGLREAGLIENRHVVVEVAWITTDADTARTVSELVEHGARLLVPCGTSASLAAKRHGSKLPILFISVGNPVGIGLVESLSRPGGNATGFSDVLADLGGKLVQFALEMSRPPATVYYVWHNGWADGQYRLQATERAAQAAGVPLRARGFSDMAEANGAIMAMKKAGATTLVVQPSPFTYRQREKLIESATNQGLGTIFAFPPATREGALIAYGPDYADLYRRAGASVDRLLKGAKPSDLPVEEPAKFELLVNQRTAKALNLTVPQSLLAQATQIIQ